MKYKLLISEIIVVFILCAIAVMLAWATDTYSPEMDIDLESTYDIIDAVDISQDGDLTTGGDADVTGTITGGTLTDGTTTITGGNYTGVGNITGTDVDISAGTGDYSSTGKILIDGDTDQVQTTIQAHSTQTNDIFVIEKSDGTDYFHIEENGEVHIMHTADHNDDRSFEIDTDGAGFGDVKSVDINYTTGAIAAGEDEAIILININEIAATGGDIFGVEVLATDGSAGIYGLKAAALVGPVHQDSGTFATPTTTTDNTPSTIVEDMRDGSSITTTTIFAAVNQYIIIGETSAFEEIEFIITTGASGAGIKPTFGYSTAGSHAFTAFSPVDGTNGFRNTGVIAWDAGDLTSHGINTDTSTYDILITRTRTNLSTSPVLGYAKVAATTEYLWDKNGDLNVRSITVGTDINIASYILSALQLYIVDDNCRIYKDGTNMMFVDEETGPKSLTQLLAGGAGSGTTEDVFKTHNPTQGTSPVADTSTDTLIWTEGEGIDLTGDSAADSITVAAELASTTNKGVASFDSGDFAVTSGVVTSLGGSGDVTAAANISDNYVVRGDGGAKGIQESELYIDDNGNVGIGTATFGTNAGNVLGILVETAPTSSPADMVQLYADDITDTDTVILMHYNGSDASTTMTDEGGHTFTARNSAQLDTGDYKFPTASLIAESDTEDYIDTPDDADFDMGSSDFTCEFWINTAQTASAILCGQASAAGSDVAFYFIINDTANKIGFNINDGGNNTVVSSTSINDSAWHHIAGVRYNDEMKLYVDGTSEGTPISGLGTIPNKTTAFSIGRAGEYDGSYYDGWIDEFRLSIIARYTTDFTSSTSEFSSGYAELIGMDELENKTTLTSKDFVGTIPEEKLDEYYYPSVYECKNKLLGRRIRIDREGLARAVEKLTGEKFVYEERIPIKETISQEEYELIPKEQKGNYVSEEKIKKMPEWMQKIRQEELAKRKEEKILDKIAKELARIANLKLKEKDQPDTGVVQ